MWGTIKPTSTLCVIAVGVACLSSCGQDKPDDTGTGGSSLASSSSSDASSSVGPGSSSGGELPVVFTITGVVTDGQTPVEGATVMQGGGKPVFETGADGTFSIEMTTALPGTPTIVATKIGYRTGGFEILEMPTDPIEIVLHWVSPPDNTKYNYGDPGVGDAAIDNSTAYCGHCHTTFVAQFRTSAHAKATKDPLVQDLYAGTANLAMAPCIAAGGIFRNGHVPGTVMDLAPRCYLGGGVLPDLNGCGAPNDLSCDDPTIAAMQKPTAFGHCADCHAAGLPGATGGRDLLEATGIPYENGNHCDVCHKVRDVDLTKPPGVGGRLLIQRPHETVTGDPGAKLRNVMYGPLLDVPNEFMGGSYQPKFSQAVFCAGCHEQEQEALAPGTTIDSVRFPNGLPTHSTFTEWSESAWAAAGVPCQHCHMPPNDSLLNTVDVTKPGQGSITFGFIRPPEQIRAHTFRGPLAGPERLIDLALGMWLDTEIIGGNLSVRVKLSNQGAGHALPTGEPMRSLLLILQAEACGKRLTLLDGPTLDDVAGTIATGIVGQGLSVSNTVWTWAEGAARAKTGQVLRIVRDSGQWIDYPGIGYFANPALGPADKGFPLRTFVGETRILSVNGDALTVDQEIALQAGDMVWLGDDVPGDFVDGSPPLALAGLAGQSFARVLVDATGERLVPHYKAVDMVRDNRLLPLEPVTTAHVFAISAGCPNVSLTATALYRAVPLQTSRLRGWVSSDAVVAQRKETVVIP